MITAAEFTDFQSRLASKDIINDQAAPSWKAMMAHKREFTDNHSEKLKYKYDKAGIDHINGKAVFTGEKSLKIGEEEFTFDMAFIGAGSKPLELPFEGGFDFVCTNECFLNLDTLPKKILFIGGGYISVEFANIAGAFGSEVTIVQIDNRLVPEFDSDIVEVLTESLIEKGGVTVKTGSRVDSIAASGDGYKVFIRTKDGLVTRDVDLVVHGAGRVANIADLELNKANIETTRRGIVVNDFMQTTNESVYAGGDCTDTEAICFHL